MKLRAIYDRSRNFLFLFGWVYTLPVSCLAGLAITPLRTELTGSSGTTLSGSLALCAHSLEPASYQVMVEGLSEERSPGAPWLQISTNRIDLNPQETNTLNYTIQIPPAARGELLGRVGFMAVPSDPGASPVAIRTKISVPIHVLIEGTLEERAVIKSLSWLADDFQQLGLAVENRGNVLLRLSGECCLIDLETGAVAARLPVNEVHTPLYVGVTRIFPLKLTDRLPPGSYDAHVRVVVSEDGPILEQRQILVVPETAVSSVKP